MLKGCRESRSSACIRSDVTVTRISRRWSRAISNEFDSGDPSRKNSSASESFSSSRRNCAAFIWGYWNTLAQSNVYDGRKFTSAVVNRLCTTLACRRHSAQAFTRGHARASNPSPLPLAQIAAVARYVPFCRLSFGDQASHRGHPQWTLDADGGYGSPCWSFCRAGEKREYITLRIGSHSCAQHCVAPIAVKCSDEHSEPQNETSRRATTNEKEPGRLAPAP